MPHKDPMKALRLLKEGNQRFVDKQTIHDPSSHQDMRGRSEGGQDPFAVILGCSDSRGPVEIIFDQSLGDLFVIRVAGNVVASSQIGSVEFSVEAFSTPLIVVLGHSGCGAIHATLEELRKPSDSQSPNLKSIVERIKPSVCELLNTELSEHEAELQHAAMRANVRASVNALQHNSAILEKQVESGDVVIVGAEYDIQTGKVTFLD